MALPPRRGVATQAHVAIQAWRRHRGMASRAQAACFRSRRAWASIFIAMTGNMARQPIVTHGAAKNRTISLATCPGVRRGRAASSGAGCDAAAGALPVAGAAPAPSPRAPAPVAGEAAPAAVAGAAARAPVAGEAALHPLPATRHRRRPLRLCGDAGAAAPSGLEAVTALSVSDHAPALVARDRCSGIDEINGGSRTAGRKRSDCPTITYSTECSVGTGPSVLILIGGLRGCRRGPPAVPPDRPARCQVAGGLPRQPHRPWHDFVPQQFANLPILTGHNAKVGRPRERPRVLLWHSRLPGGCGRPARRIGLWP